MAPRYQVLARKYRPQSFREVVGQEAAVTTLKNAIRFDKVAGGYLFCGSRGVGKTTLARLFAKALNCSAPTPDLEPCNTCPSCKEITSGQALDVIEIDGASNRGIDDIRQINETVGYAPSHGNYKIYIIDEVHMLTKEAFNALLKTLEEPPEKAKFFFATTEAHKVLPTIISRCQRFDLARIPSSLIAAKLEQIAKDLQRTVEPEALQLIATFSEGSLRDAESLFDQILCFAEGEVTAATVRQSLGLVPKDLFLALDQAFSEYRLSYAFELVDQLFQTGKDLGHFLEQLIEHYRTVVKGAGSSPSVYTQQQAIHILDLLIQSEAQFQKSAYQRIALESILLQIIRSKNRIPIEVLVRRLSELEQNMGKLPTPNPLPREEQPAAQDTLVQPKIPELKEVKPSVETAPPETLNHTSTEKRETEPEGSSEYPSRANDNCERQGASEDVNSGKKIVGEENQIVSHDVSKKELLPSPPLAELPKSAPFPKIEPQAPNQESLKEPALKPVPFTPNTASAPKENPTKRAAKTEDKTSPKNSHPQYHYDTLMRFTAIELEGTIKLG